MGIWISALAVGLVMGLSGAGGGIITVPALMFGAQMSSKEAVAHSLLILALLCWISAIVEWRKGNLKFGSALAFAVAGVAGSFLGARLISPLLTEPIQLTLFCFFLILASGSMVKTAFQGRPKPHGGQKKSPYVLLGLAGITVGLVAGMLGLGGGFLIVPALILILSFNAQQAVGTALGIIALNSTSGFIGYLGLVEFRWGIASLFAGCGLAGSFLGMKVRSKIPDRAFKILFAIALLAMGIYILIDRVIPAFRAA